MANENTEVNELREHNMKKGMIERTALEMLQATQKRKELNELIGEKKEELVALFEELQITDYHFDTEEEGETKLIEILLKFELKSKLDKGELAETLDVERGDLDTKGMIALTSEGTLTTDIYQDHLVHENKSKLSLKKKRKPKKKSTPEA